MSPFVFPLFDGVIATIKDEHVKKFADIEDQVLEVVGEFDRRRVAGEISAGEYQTKAKFFNELIASLIDECVGKPQAVAVRGKRPGVLLPQIDVDICFPSDPSVRPLLVAETKIAGAPQNPDNVETQGRLGRAGTADLDKRLREIVMNVIDLKLADPSGSTEPIGDLTTWIQSTPPHFFAFLAFRIIDAADRRRAEQRAQLLQNSYANGVGLFMHEPVDKDSDESLTTYRTIPAPPGLDIDSGISRVCRQIKARS